jgi:hypothetical protein
MMGATRILLSSVLRWHPVLPTATENCCTLIRVGGGVSYSCVPKTIACQ